MSRKSKTLELCNIAIGAILICICAWITIPTPIPFTMQTFAIFTVLRLLGGKRGLASVVLYILLGLIGIPVFSGFIGGPGVFYTVTGGYIPGFLLMAIIYWLLTACFKQFKYIDVIALMAGLTVCYISGALWYAHLSGGLNLFFESLYISVIPFIVPDIIKLFFARFVAKSLKKHLKVL